MRTVLQHVECFHLVLLRLLESRVDRAAWVVKGGVNLRAWFGSLRYSEDLDIDVVRGTVHGLREKVDRLLAAPVLRELLAAQRLVLLRSSKPKQTATMQRWKFQIRPEDGLLSLHTRVELSRSGSAEEHVLEPVRPEVVRPYGLLAPTANHYTARGAVRQKIAALALRAERQARDIWDLEHLLRTTGVDPRPLSPALKQALPAAVGRVLECPFDAFKSQVIPYLATEHQELYATPDVWARISGLVVERLRSFVREVAR